MFERLIKQNPDGLWRDDGGAVYEIHETAVSYLRIVQLPVTTLWDEFVAKQKDPTREPNPWWNCANMPPQDEEIKRAVDQGRLQCERNDLNQHLKDRTWHIERVAFLACQWKDNDPIRMKRISDMEIDDGAHRLVAARYLKKETILAYDSPLIVDAN